MTTSSKSVLVSSLLSLHRVPMISPEATSDVLSDNSDHAYFLRLVPPDRYQADVIGDVIAHFNWTYISLLYTAGTYGSSLSRQIKATTRRRGVCIAHAEELAPDAEAGDLERTVRQLRKHMNARVVVLVLSVQHARLLLTALQTQGRLQPKQNRFKLKIVPLMICRLHV